MVTLDFIPVEQEDDLSPVKFMSTTKHNEVPQQQQRHEERTTLPWFHC
jgi:hypothetical protein